MYNGFILLEITGDPLHDAQMRFFDFFLFFYDILFFYILKNYAMKWKKWQENQDRATIL